MKLFKKLSLRKGLRLNNQSGQAVVEYVLILIISVTLLFLARGLFSGLNNFMTSYVGDYFKCLMVQGELPALGVSDTQNLARHTSAGYKCSVNYQSTASGPGTNINPGGASTNIGTAKPISPAQGSTKQTAARRGSSSANNPRKSAKNTDRDALDGSLSDGGGFQFGSNVRSRNYAYNTSDAEASSDRVSSVRLGGYGDPERYRTVSSRMQDDLLQNTRGGGVQQRGPRSRNVPLLAGDDDNRPGPRRSRFEPPTRVVATFDESVDEPFTIGHFMKWLIIAGIGIAIFILIGGQVMNYRNSDNE